MPGKGCHSGRTYDLVIPQSNIFLHHRHKSASWAANPVFLVCDWHIHSVLLATSLIQINPVIEFFQY